MAIQKRWNGCLPTLLVVSSLNLVSRINIYNCVQQTYDLNPKKINSTGKFRT